MKVFPDSSVRGSLHCAIWIDSENSADWTCMRMTGNPQSGVRSCKDLQAHGQAAGSWDSCKNKGSRDDREV